jgi:hypothetical protein
VVDTAAPQQVEFGVRGQALMPQAVARQIERQFVFELEV